MSVLALEAGDTGVTAVVVTGDGAVAARARRAVATIQVSPGQVSPARVSPAQVAPAEVSPAEIWRAALGALSDVLAAYDGPAPLAVGLTARRDTLVLWDRETLSSPRPAMLGSDLRAAGVCDSLRDGGTGERVPELTGHRLDPRLTGPRLAWLAEHEPHTWALVEAGRYAVGTVESYLVARMTRGTWHVTDVSHAAGSGLLDLATGAWSDELCGAFGVPRDALPDLVPSWGEVAVTDPRLVSGLSLPVTGMAADQQAALFGQARFASGETACTLGAETLVTTNTGGERRGAGDGWGATAAWRSPDGVLTYARMSAVDPTPGRETGSETDSGTGSGTGSEEAVTGVAALLAAAPGVASLRVGGAAGTDDRLCQALADRTGLGVERPRTLEASVLGAAHLAGLGVGLWASTDVLRERWALDRRFDPTR